MAQDSGADAATASGDAVADGRPLDTGVRAEFEALYRRDFSDVRVHTGAAANRSAEQQGALAYALGNDLVFRDGAYDPLTPPGRSVIGHELAHVAQAQTAPGGGRGALVRPMGLAAQASRMPSAGAALEGQAHRAASIAASRSALPASWSWHRPSAPFVGRIGPGDAAAEGGVDASTTDVVPAAPPGPAATVNIEYPRGTRIDVAEELDPGVPSAVRLLVPEFSVPTRKGPWAERYAAIAQAGALQAIVNSSDSYLRAGLWQKRAAPPELRQLWLSRMGWLTASASEWWGDAGGDVAAGAFAPKSKGVSAQIDHIVELQLGGTNVPENLAPHNGPDNEESGRAIWGDLSTAVRSYLALGRHPGGSSPRRVALKFGTAVQAGTYPDTAPLAAPAASGSTRDWTARRGAAANALQVHFTALQDKTARIRPNDAELAAAAAAVAALPAFPLAAGPSTHTFRFPQHPGGLDLVQASTVDVNRQGRELISGMALIDIDRRNVSAMHANAVIGAPPGAEAPRAGTRLPFEFGQNGTPVALTIVPPAPAAGGAEPAPASLRLANPARQIAFTYPYLSPGVMTLNLQPDGTIGGSGHITPTIPLLRNTRVGVEWDSAGVRASLDAPPERLSLPPFRVTRAALVATISPALDLRGTLAFQLGSRITGDLNAGVDAQGVFATGEVRANIPGLDEARGGISYRPGAGLTGFAVARASRPSGLVRSGEVRVDFAGSNWRLSGDIGVMLPGNSPATLSVRREGERVVYSGRATLAVPGLHPVDVDVRYDGEHVSGGAHTTFAVLGVTGDLALRYNDGRFSGRGTVALSRGRFAGSVEANLNEDGVVTGRGTGTFTFRPGLVGTISLEYGRDRRLHTTGELRFPPYRFLEPRGGRYQLFQHDLPDIPLFAIPVGPRSIGLIARIGGGLAARYSFGPGEIRDMVIRASLYPLEQDLEAELSAEATLVLPAMAGLELSVRAGIGLSAGVADATGGITVTGGIELRGGASSTLHLSYARGVFVFDSRTEINVRPVLTLRITADFTIEVIAMDPIRYPYELARYEYDPGLMFGMVAPFHYQSDQPLRLPEPGDIQWIVPEIDVGALSRQIGSRVRGGLNL